MRVFKPTSLALVAILCCPGAFAADEPTFNIATSTCAKDLHLQLTLALPAYYLDQNGRFNGEVRGAENAPQVCGAFALGSPYQLVSWLENGAVQAAVLTSFAVSVMKADDPERFDQDYFALPRQALPNLPPYDRRLMLYDSQGQEIANADARLMDFFTALQQRDKVTILLPSHLSPAMPYLIRTATDWADQQELDRDRRETFYAALIAATRFGERDDLPSQMNPPTYVISEHIERKFRRTKTVRPAAPNELRTRETLNLDDWVVVRKRVLLASKSLREDAAEAVSKSQDISKEPAKAVPLFAKTPEEEALLGPVLTKFRETNYRRLQFGNVAQRHFRFTIPELWAQLGRGSADEKLALVLTGGGVKAAYQTSMIDYLYKVGRLANGSSETPREAVTQRVDYVIGTSGGALLGVFVAAMDENFAQLGSRQPKGPLTAILWKEPGNGIHSYDVFPILDLMRYASLIAALVVVWLVAGFALEVFRKQFSHVTRLDHSDESFFERRARAWKESWPWMVLLVFAPIVIVKVASVSHVEHMRTETGLYYAWMALVAFYSDVRLTPIALFEWRRARVTRRTVIAVIAGLACIAAAFLFADELRKISQARFGDPGAIAVNLSCIGFVVLIHAVHLFFHDQKQFFSPEPRAKILGAFFVLLGIVLLSYLGVLLAMALDRTSLLEMNGGFWMYFLALAAALTVVLMFLGRAGAASRVSGWAQDKVCYLFSEYRSRAIFGSERRFMRFMTLTLSAWVWWNLLAAPALYGNSNARAFLHCAFTDFTNVVHPGRAAKRCENEERAKVEAAEEEPFALKVPFVITATSLEKSQERYFLFVSGTDKHIDDSLSPEAWFNVVRDPRWVVVRKPVDSELEDAAFASGSPFPVFSAHDVELRVLRHKDRLIDGGFAHNRPLEAALALGANKVLVINSSPIEVAASGGQCSLMAFSMGELACNLPKLLPYLWERSQVEDLLSTRGMLVASIYPTAESGVWPSLTDFRRRSVLDLLDAAEKDKDLRVGVIESWGAPNFTSVGLFSYDASAIKAVIRTSAE
ncbi:MAG TPA: patatin-like phospholipase family protein [Steroidobacteraceae bacterium]|jgi:predicted acylesterase/phospholipase RssA|nr:patatin-like phospholipase family protein [Steroidobacteraceae bacterium]